MIGASWPKAMPALITPFTVDGEFDADSHHHNISLMMERGCRGVLVAGSTGEGPLLERGERRSLVRGAREVSDDLTVICGINGESTRQAVAQVGEAATGGADAVLVTTPTTLSRNRLPFVERFYGEVAEESPVPIVLYTVPKVTGWELPTESVNRLAAHPNIVGMKDSGGDPSRLDDLTSTLAAGFTVYAGASRALHESGKKGVHGSITASGNYALTEASLAVLGDAHAQQRLTALTSVVEAFGVPGTKFAASLVGLRPGHARSPLSTVDAGAQSAIVDAMADAGIG